MIFIIILGPTSPFVLYSTLPEWPKIGSAFSYNAWLVTILERGIDNGIFNLRGAWDKS